MAEVMADKQKWTSPNDEEDWGELEKLEQSDKQSDNDKKAKTKQAIVIAEDDVFYAIKLVYNNLPKVCRLKQKMLDDWCRKKNKEAKQAAEHPTDEYDKRIMEMTKRADDKMSRWLEKNEPAVWKCRCEECEQAQNCSRTADTAKEITDLRYGDLVIIPSQYGNEVGIVTGRMTDEEELKKQDEILDVIRIANKEDIDRYHDNQKRAFDAYEVTKQKIAEHGLDMKLLNIHFFFDNSKAIFNFTSPSRVDFRRLVQDLAAIFKTRIEMHQCGVRDECRIIGGYGQCGRHFCCSKVMSSLDAITIKMAKEQNLTLNSLKISGTCGRLLCCLSYEYRTYLEEKAGFPNIESRVNVDGEIFVVKDVNVQSRNIKLCSKDDDRIVTVHADDLERDDSGKWVYRGDELEEE